MVSNINEVFIMAEEANKVAVITGASSGIGMATAQEFAAKGYDVVLAARRKSELDEVAQRCQDKHGVRALSITTDTTDDTAVRALAEAAVSEFGRIDVWVNNAAVYLTGKFEDVPLEDMRRVIDTNLFGYLHGAHAALAQFRLQGHGTLINVSSVNAAAPQPYVSIYSASKAAIRAFDESLRMELRLEGLAQKIRVCTVMPASIDTNLFQNAANYTGKKVQALEPVYDPTYVAKRIVRLVKYPRRQTIVGPAGLLMALQNAHSPRSYEKQVGKYTEADLLAEEEVQPTRGNLYEPMLENRGMRGGWREQRIRADRLNAGLGVAMAAAAGVASLAYLLLKRKRTTQTLPELPRF